VIAIAIGVDVVAPLGGGRNDDLPEQATDVAKGKVVGDKGKENEKQANGYKLGGIPQGPRKKTMLSNARIVYTSTVRFSEGQLPHNTVIPDHNERQTSPKVSTIALPHIPR
jgi:hypothetical protein